jgi:hypothetical protein
MVISGSDGVTFPDSTTQNTTDRYGFVNRIINGDCRIAQRGTAAVTTQNSFPVDRFKINNSSDGAFSAQQDSSAPTGFLNSVKVTITTADASLTTTQQLQTRYPIEGTNVADLAWGTASAKTVTLSFWTRSSLTGTFGGALRNADNTRSYPFAYSISVADTWEYKSVTIAGDATGTWVTDTGVGITIDWSLGAGPDRSGTAGAWAGANYGSSTGATSVVGTLNATWFITGVQLEVGSVATPFERRPYGAELALCQRYYYRITSTSHQLGAGWNRSTTQASGITTFPVTMRVVPSSLETTGTAANYRVLHANTATVCSSVPTLERSTDHTGSTEFVVSSGLTTGQGSAGAAASTVTAYLGWSAEL